MTAQEAIAYLERTDWASMRLGLDRTRELLARMGDPQKKLHFVHVAGTNGKGSACAMLSSVLTAAGYTTGLHTSPYVCRFHERMQVNGQDITDEELASVTEFVAGIADRMSDHPSQFELVTAAAFEFFARRHCDIVVLEVGLGGTNDATNVIDCPEVAVIMNIGLEHTEYLGSTLAAIAGHKAGIIKAGGEAVCYRGAPEVENVFETVCREKNAALHKADFDAIRPFSHTLDGQRFSYKNTENILLPLLGEHQLRNAAVVLEAVGVLRRRGYAITEEQLREGLAAVRWPARFEVVKKDPLFLVDGGHNPQCAEALADLLREYLPGEKLTILMGVLADKDYTAMLRSIWPFAERFYCVTPDNSRALKAEQLAEVIRSLGGQAEAFDSVKAGTEAALACGDNVLAFGSLYMAGEIRRRALCTKR